MDHHVASEHMKNVFTEFYQVPPPAKNQKKKPEPASVVLQLLKDYKHKDAINFAATSLMWTDRMENFHQKLPRASGDLPFFNTVLSTHAFYRVIGESPNTYTLTACHVNIHGYHRGDLRFIEINDRTVTRGSERTSVIGKLYLGDIVGVTELACRRKFEEVDVFKSSLDSNCIWMASKITVLPRNILKDVTFSMLKNGCAIVKEQNEVMNVSSEMRKLKPEKLYTGVAFLPEKMQFNFTEDHTQEQKNYLIAKSSKIHQYPNALGTIFSYSESPELTDLFTTGIDAFSGFAAFRRARCEEIVETCVLMGYAAANSISNGRFDERCFVMQYAERRGPIATFYIDNPTEKPTEGRWNNNNRIKIGGPNVEVNAVIETVIIERGLLKIVARLSRETPHWIKFKDDVFIVSQREPSETQVLRKGFFTETPTGSNGRRIIETLYGGPSIPVKHKPFDLTGSIKDYVIGTSQKIYRFPSKEQIRLNEFQCDYVEMMLNGNPMVVGSSPFGCGKSMTIVAAALEIHKRARNYESFHKQLLITQSNYASVNLVDISQKIEEDSLGVPCKFVRYLSEKNFKELSEDCLTSFDLPNLMKTSFLPWAKGQQDSPQLQYTHKLNMVYYLLKGKLIDTEKFDGDALRIYRKIQAKQENRAWPRELVEAFFILYNPDIIMTTADSLQALLSLNILTKHSVSTIQIDEASQVPEYTLIGLLTSFPNSTFGLIGDIQQLPPYCDTDLEGLLKDYGIGNTMERAVDGNLFPQAMLRAVYRCHPKTTDLLSELFYKGKLISEAKEHERNIFMLKRPDFWPNSNFPILVVDNKGKSQKMGTSSGNHTEKAIVNQIISCLLEKENLYKLKPSDVGVISFYKAQTSLLTESLRGQGVKCGTVDAFQGTERDVVILCCTNEKTSEFMQLSNRINVAMSRAKQVTIIVGNLEGLKKANYWSTIVKRAQENGCIIEPNQIGDLGAPREQSFNKNSRNRGSRNSNNNFNKNNSRNNTGSRQGPRQDNLTDQFGSMRISQQQQQSNRYDSRNSNAYASELQNRIPQSNWNNSRSNSLIQEVTPYYSSSQVQNQSNSTNGISQMGGASQPSWSNPRATGTSGPVQYYDLVSKQAYTTHNISTTSQTRTQAGLTNGMCTSQANRPISRSGDTLNRRPTQPVLPNRKDPERTSNCVIL